MISFYVVVDSSALFCLSTMRTLECTDTRSICDIDRRSLAVLSFNPPNNADAVQKRPNDHVVRGDESKRRAADENRKDSIFWYAGAHDGYVGD